MTGMVTERLARYQGGEFLNTPSVISDNITIRVAETADDLSKVFEFRYDIYGSEGVLPQFYADHANRRIKDPLDSHAHNLVAYQGSEVVGTLRINFARDSDIAYYDQFLEMNTAGEFHPAATSIATRLLVIPRLRGSSLAVRLSQAAYTLGLRHEIRYNFLDCNHQMTHFFERLGYVFQSRAEHPEYGVGSVMRLDLLDRLHLARVRSPFLPILDGGSPWGDAARPFA